MQGDTTSAFAASLAAFLADVPVVHVEAGLRTGNKRSPFPEEANRRLTSVVTALHLAPTVTARAQPRARVGRPGDDPGHRQHRGRCLAVGGASSPSSSPTSAWPRLGRERELVLVTTHRRESWGEPMQQAMAGIGDVARAHPELDVLLPLHRNSVVRDAVQSALGEIAQRDPDRAPRLRGVRAPDGPVPPRRHRLRRRAGGGAELRQAGAGAARHHRAARGSRGRSRAAGRHRSGGEWPTRSSAWSPSPRRTPRWRAR